MAPSQNRSRKELFKHVSDAQEKDLFLVESCSIFAPTLIWTQNQEFSFDSFIRQINHRQQTFLANEPAQLDVNLFQDMLIKNFSSECYFNIPLARANVFFRTAFLKKTPNGLVFAIPTNLFKVQRRENIRYRYIRGQNLYVTFDDLYDFRQTQSKLMYDVSASGLSFITSTNDVNKFTLGQTLKNLTFRVKSKEIATEGKISSSKIISGKLHERLFGRLPGKLLKIGLSFQNIAPVDAQWIASFVFEETRKFTPISL